MDSRTLKRKTCAGKVDDPMQLWRLRESQRGPTASEPCLSQIPNPKKPLSEAFRYVQRLALKERSVVLDLDISRVSPFGRGSDIDDCTRFAQGRRLKTDKEGFLGDEAILLLQKGRHEKECFYQSKQSLQESYDKLQARLRTIRTDIPSTFEEIKVLEKKLAAYEEKFVFMQDFLNCVYVVSGHLEDCRSQIESLKDQMLEINRKRTRAIVEKRDVKDKDEMNALEAAVEGATSFMQRYGGDWMIHSPYRYRIQEAALCAYFAAKKASKQLVQLDEFGRDVNCENPMDFKGRAEVQQRSEGKSGLECDNETTWNEAKRGDENDNDEIDLEITCYELDCRVESAFEISEYESIEGDSSSDESDNEITEYESKRTGLLKSAEQILASVGDQYAQFAFAVECFHHFKKGHREEYSNSQLSEYSLSFFSVYVELELLSWNPLRCDTQFDMMDWHVLLDNCGLAEVDSDPYLVAKLVRDLAPPILHRYVEVSWDEFSRHQTKCAVSAINSVLKYVEHSSTRVQKLIILICDSLSGAVAKLSIPLWNTMVLDALPYCAQTATYRFGMSVRLMRNICMWNKILAPDALEKIALDDLLGGKVLPYLRCIQSSLHDAIKRSERIVSSLDGVWAGTGVIGKRSSKLQPFVDYIFTLGEKLKEMHVDGGYEREIIIFAQRVKKMLVELNELDHAKSISATFNL